MGGKSGRRVCEAMRGLVEEAQHELEEHDKGPILDLVIVSSQQRIEHYEISAYGTMVELSKAMGESEVADLLAQTLAEEKQQDEKLTEITRSSILPEALSSREEEEEDEEEDSADDEQESRPPARKPSRNAKRSR